jgi:multimeric flavodoxin WrbA
MKIVCLLGSPRANGNSAAVARRFCSSAAGFGAQVKTYLFNDLVYRGCQGCMLCKTKLDRCALEDDLTEVLDAIREAEIVVLASPVYFWDVSSQVKAFLDRAFSYLVPDFFTNPVKSRLPAGKKLVFILAQANPDPSMFTDIFPKFDYFFRTFGFIETHLIRACGVGAPGDVEGHEEVMKLAEKTAATLCGIN